MTKPRGVLIKVLTDDGIRWRSPGLCQGGCGQPTALSASSRHPGNPTRWASQSCRQRFIRTGTCVIPPKTCRCGNEFLDPSGHRVYCSTRCQWNANNERRRGPGAEPRACAGCGLEWTPTANNSKAAYCSRRCYGAENKRRYRARVAGAPVVEIVLTLVVMERDGWICQLCNEPIPRDVKNPHPLFRSVDHRIPLARGGNHTMDNVQAAHLLCNSRKWTRLDEELDREFAGDAAAAR